MASYPSNSCCQMWITITILTQEWWIDERHRDQWSHCPMCGMCQRQCVASLPHWVSRSPSVPTQHSDTLVFSHQLALWWLAGHHAVSSMKSTLTLKQTFYNHTLCISSIWHSSDILQPPYICNSQSY